MLIDKRIGKDEEYPETTIRGKTYPLPAGTVVLGHGYFAVFDQFGNNLDEIDELIAIVETFVNQDEVDNE
jgi:hypothetical protein